MDTAIWKSEGPFQQEPELPGVDYRVRHLAQVLAADPRFADVHLKKRGHTLVIDAPESLSVRERVTLRGLIHRHFGKNRVILRKGAWTPEGTGG